MEIHSVIRQGFPDQLGGFGVDLGQDARLRFKYSYVGTQAGEGLGQLAPDGTSADDSEPLGKGL